MPDPFISTQDVIDLLGRGGTADPGILIAVDAACDVVRDLTELTINKVYGDTVYLNGTGTETLLLPQRPVSAAGTVTVNGGTVTDYALANNGNGILYRGTAGGGVWPRGRQNVRVTYDHGFADDDIPRSVRVVALQLACRLVVQGAAVEEQIGQTRVKYAGAALDLTNSEKAILAKYRQIRAA
jgi:hypothetical protein